jgi:hypothetical protein
LKLIAASADRDHGSRHVVSRVSLKKQILSILFLVKSKTCFAFANYLVSSKEKWVISPPGSHDDDSTTASISAPNTPIGSYKRLAAWLTLYD